MQHHKLTSLGELTDMSSGAYVSVLAFVTCVGTRELHHFHHMLCMCARLPWSQVSVTTNDTLFLKQRFGLLGYVVHMANHMYKCRWIWGDADCKVSSCQKAPPAAQCHHGPRSHAESWPESAGLRGSILSDATAVTVAKNVVVMLLV